MGDLFNPSWAERATLKLLRLMVSMPSWWRMEGKTGLIEE